MAKTVIPMIFLLILVGFVVLPVKGLVPFTRALWDDHLDDPFRVLEAQTPLPLPKISNFESLRFTLLAREDWKETQNVHIISLDIPGMKKEDVKIEVEQNRVLKVSGQRKSEAEVEHEHEGDKWHRAERTTGKFWRQFRLPANAELDNIKAHLENGVLKITVPKLAEEKRRQSRVIDISVNKSIAQDLKTNKADM